MGLRKTATNLSLSEDLVRRARALGLNLSKIVEGSLEAAVHKAEGEAWQKENRDAIASYNRRVAKRGVFGDRLRRF